MARQRLINCDFINASSFKVDTSNKAKLLYLFMFMNADDKGFVDNTKEIMDLLEKNDADFTNEVNLTLLANDYESALQELIDKGYLYEFKNKYNNKVHLIRHWYFHNRMKKGLWTSYGKYLGLVEIIDNEYILKEKVIPKENSKLNQDKLNEIKLKESKLNQEKEETEPFSIFEEINYLKETFGVEKFSELNEEQKQQLNDYIANRKGA